MVHDQQRITRDDDRTLNKIIYLVRRCAAVGQEPDAPLTAAGYQQALALADWLSP